MKPREKVLLDKEIDIYTASKQLSIDKELLIKERANWVIINEIREKRRTEEVKEVQEIARLQAKREALLEVNAIKDQEIALLKDLLTKAIDALRQPQKVE